MSCGISQCCRTVLLLAALSGCPAWADQTDARLPPLFAQLSDANGRDMAGPIEAEIWEIWGQSGIVPRGVV